ncbi:hypothetical protein RHGRI_026483 [Rhododendron griersonianum]|uniref:Uncharacterized protein n=1 Tax=Rhododendron griersonianum TaxID=479676 RepID=A0AAV6IWK5_9ERIC|nr:hypothetical protein RHGRI_026483 [Rhododendron griersonianum]
MEKEPLSTRYCSLQIRAINTTQKQKPNQSPNKQKPPPPSPTAPPNPNPTTPQYQTPRTTTAHLWPSSAAIPTATSSSSANPRNPPLERPQPPWPRRLR